MFQFIFALFFSFEFKTSPYKTVPTRAERFDPTEDEDEDSSITSFEKGSPANTLKFYRMLWKLTFYSEPESNFLSIAIKILKSLKH